MVGVLGLRVFFFFFYRNCPFLKYEKNWGSEVLVGGLRIRDLSTWSQKWDCKGEAHEGSLKAIAFVSV